MRLSDRAFWLKQVCHDVIVDLKEWNLDLKLCSHLWSKQLEDVVYHSWNQSLVLAVNDAFDLICFFGW